MNDILEKQVFSRNIASALHCLNLSVTENCAFASIKIEKCVNTTNEMKNYFSTYIIISYYIIPYYYYLLPLILVISSSFSNQNEIPGGGSVFTIVSSFLMRSLRRSILSLDWTLTLHTLHRKSTNQITFVFFHFPRLAYLKCNLFSIDQEALRLCALEQSIW